MILKRPRAFSGSPCFKNKNEVPPPVKYPLIKESNKNLIGEIAESGSVWGTLPVQTSLPNFGTES